MSDPILQAVLSHLPAFVFIKQFDPATGQFVFRYMNEQLSRAFSLSDPRLAYGLSDVDFLPNEEQRRRFRDADLEAHNAPDSECQVVREEDITPPGINAQTLRLATIKKPIDTSAFASDGKIQRLVLGIAVDFTAITGLLNAIVASCRDAVYVKDEHRRYQLVNPTFLRLLGNKASSEVLGKTFDEIFDSSNEAPHENLACMCKDIAEEDARVLSGSTVEQVRKAVFSDQQQWHTRKEHVSSGPHGQPHILGIARSVFGGMTRHLLDRLPQCVCVKDDAHKIVWCNYRFAERHGYSDPKQLLGRTDFDFWPIDRFPRQAQGYRDKDELVLQIGRENGPDIHPAKLEEILREADCIEYREEQTDRELILHKLQTTKWPEYIAGRWHVVVVYSDVTRGDELLVKYHRFTVHAMSTALLPVGAARRALKDFRDDARRPREKLDRAMQMLDVGAENLDFYLDHHLSLLRMDLSKQVMDISVLIPKIVRESRLIGEIFIGELSADCEVPDGDEVTGMRVLADVDFLTAVLKELLRNARKAIDRRRSFEERSQRERELSGAHSGDRPGWPWKSGAINVKIRVVYADAVNRAEPRLCIEIADNGKATIDATEQDSLRKMMKRVESNPHAEQKRLGLAFAWLVIQHHAGQLVLDCNSKKTALLIYLPIILPVQSPNKFTPST